MMLTGRAHIGGVMERGRSPLALSRPKGAVTACSLETGASALKYLCGPSNGERSTSSPTARRVVSC